MSTPAVVYEIVPGPSLAKPGQDVIILNTNTDNITISGPDLSLLPASYQHDMAHAAHAALADHDVQGAIRALHMELDCADTPLPIQDALPKAADQPTTTHQLQPTHPHPAGHAIVRHGHPWLLWYSLSVLLIILVFWTRRTRTHH